MNSKKAKALRRLTEHLQQRGVIQNDKWADVGTTGEQRMLNPSCGKSIYRAMKKRDSNGRS